MALTGERLRPALLLAFFLLVAFPLPAFGQGSDPAPGLSGEIRSIIESPRYRYARWGLFVLDLDTRRPVYAFFEDRLLGIASVTKLFSAAAALEELGSDYRVETPVYIRGRVDEMGNLQGSIIVVSRGPMFSLGRDDEPQKALAELAERIRAAGIKAIKGDVVVDDRCCKRYTAYSVAVPGRCLYVISAAMIRDSLVDVTLRATRPGEPVRVAWRPRTAYVRLRSSCRTGPPGGKQEVEIRGEEDGSIVVEGYLPQGSPPVTKRVAVGDPASFLRSLFIDALREAGVKLPRFLGVKNPLRLLPAAGEDGLRRLTLWSSPPLKDYLRTILKESHNPGADLLPLLMAVKVGDGTFPAGMKRIGALLAKAGIERDTVSLGDGSGLSPANLATPRSVVSLLSYMTGHREYGVFRGSLPVLGVDGSLKGAVGEGNPVQGKVAAKTGTISLFDLANDSGFVQIKALAGYMTTTGGRNFAFAVMVNGVHGTAAPDREGVLKDVAAVGGDLVKIVELIYHAH